MNLNEMSSIGRRLWSTARIVLALATMTSCISIDVVDSSDTEPGATRQQQVSFPQKFSVEVCTNDADRNRECDPGEPPLAFAQIFISVLGVDGDRIDVALEADQNGTATGDFGSDIVDIVGYGILGQGGAALVQCYAGALEVIQTNPAASIYEYETQFDFMPTACPGEMVNNTSNIAN